MKLYKLFLPILSWVLCCGHMTTMMFTSNRAGGIIVAESSGLAFPKTPDSVIRVSDFVRAAGLGYGATVVLNELQNQQTLELETLLSNKGAV